MNIILIVSPSFLFKFILCKYVLVRILNAVREQIKVILFIPNMIFFNGLEFQSIEEKQINLICRTSALLSVPLMHTFMSFGYKIVLFWILLNIKPPCKLNPPSQKGRWDTCRPRNSYTALRVRVRQDLFFQSSRL